MKVNFLKMKKIFSKNFGKKNSEFGIYHACYDEELELGFSYTISAECWMHKFINTYLNNKYSV